MGVCVYDERDHSCLSHACMVKETDVDGLSYNTNILYNLLISLSSFALSVREYS